MKKKLLLTALAAGLVLPSVNALAEEKQYLVHTVPGVGKVEIEDKDKDGQLSEEEINAALAPATPGTTNGTDGINGTPKAEELTYAILVKVDDKVRAYKLSVPTHKPVTESGNGSELVRIYELVKNEGIAQGKNFLAGDVMDLDTAVATGVIQLPLLSEDVDVKTPEKEEGKKALPKTSAVK